MSLQIEQVRPLLNSGLSYTKAAERLGVKRGAVAGVDWRAKNPAKVEAYRRARSGKTATREQVIAARKAFVRRCFPMNSQDQRFLDLYATGLTLREIGDKCSCVKETVRLHLMRMGSVHKLTAIAPVEINIEDFDDEDT